MSMHPDTDDESGPITAEGLLRRRAVQDPGAIALIDPPNRQMVALTRPRSFTYGEADEAVDALAAFFVGLGLKPGDRVVLQLPNFIEAPLTLLGAWRAGLTVATIPMLWRAMEIAKVCDLLEPKALIGASHFAKGKPAEMLHDVAATRPCVNVVLGYGLSLPDGVLSLDDVIGAGRLSHDKFVARTQTGPSLITFTARANAPLVPLLRHEEEILAQGAMTVLALSLLRSDTILNASPLTGPIGLALGLAPWLIGGGALVQHDPFDSDAFAEQLYDSGATVTALPGAFLDKLTDDGVLDDPQCKLRRVGRVWSATALADRAPSSEDAIPEDVSPSDFDVYPLGDLACLIVRPEQAEARPLLPLGSVHLGEDGGGAVFAETSLAENATGEVLLRGPVVPQGKTGGPALRDEDGFVATGLHGQANGHGGMKLFRDPELVHHGGFTVAAAELDGLYQAFPGFLDAACFVLPDPIIGDRIFAAVAPLPNAPISLAVLHSFLMERGVAPYKFPDRLLVVRDIPRDRAGRIERQAILERV